MRDPEIERLVQAAAHRRGESEAEVDLLFAEMNADLEGWCRRRSRLVTLRRRALAVSLVAFFALLPLYVVGRADYLRITATGDPDQAYQATYRLLKNNNMMS